MQIGRIATEPLPFLSGVSLRRLTLSLLVTPCGHGLSEALFILGKKGKSPVTVSPEMRMHVLKIFTCFFIPGFGFTNDIKIRVEGSMYLIYLLSFNVKIQRSVQDKTISKRSYFLLPCPLTYISFPYVSRTWGCRSGCLQGGDI